MELRFIVFLHITNRPVSIENIRLCMPRKGEGGSESGEKKIELIYNTSDRNERAHTLWCCSS